MPVPAFPFDAVLFDLDGTLVATERYWPDAARAGALAAFRELGLEREPPTRGEWMGLVGLDLAQGFEALFPDLTPGDRLRVMERCVEAEHELVADGRAAPLPGVLETLAELRRRGVRMGVASNCSRSYLEAMMEGLGLARWVHEARCLDSPGIDDKADMVEDLLLTFDTRSAVMVGDRAGDRDAAWANGLPHVHLARGYAAAGEEVRCEASIEGMDELIRRLEGRDRWLGQVLAALSLPAGPATLGITGGPLSGKSLFARDLARVVAGQGRRVRLEGRLEGAGAPAPDAPDAPDAPGELTIREGSFLLDPSRGGDLDRVLFLSIPDELALRRAAGADRSGRAARLEELSQERLPAQARFEARHPPETADLVLDGTNPLGPPGTLGPGLVPGPSDGL